MFDRDERNVKYFKSLKGVTCESVGSVEPDVHSNHFYWSTGQPMQAAMFLLILAKSPKTQNYIFVFLFASSCA